MAGNHSSVKSPDERGYPELSLVGMLRAGFATRGWCRLGASENESITYFDAYRDANALAYYLEDTCGCGPRSTVVLSSPNVLLFPVIIAAVQMCGARVALLAPTLPNEEFIRCASSLNPDVIIMSTSDGSDVARQAFPSAHVLAVGCLCAPVPLISEAISQAGYDESRHFRHIDADSEIVVFSSGSTGRPKAIANKLSSFALNGIALKESLGLVPDDRIFVPVPFIHVFGVVGMFATLVSCATFVSSEKYHSRIACQLIAGQRATVHLGVSTMFVRELRENQDDEWDFSSLRAGLVAGAGCPASVIVDFERRFGCRIMQSYGMSETAATLTVTPLDLPAERRAATAGFCIKGAEAKLDPDSGELLCKSASMMKGILQPDGSLRLDLEDGWFRTGDVAQMDDEGYITIVGRIKDMIIRGGVNIFPAEVERIYDERDDIDSCCLVGFPDPDLGERTCLAVMMKQGRDAYSRDLRQYAKGLVEKQKIPDVVLKFDEFPQLGNGKIDKKALRALVVDTMRQAGEQNAC